MLRTNVKQGPRVLAYTCVMYKMNQGCYQMYRKSTNARHPWRLPAPASFVCCEHVNYATSNLKVMLKVDLK